MHTVNPRTVVVELVGACLQLYFRVQVRVAALCLGYPHVLAGFSVYERRLGPVYMLRFLGASVGEEVHIEPGLTIQNATNGRCSNLTIGNHVFIGPRFFVELALPVTLEDECCISPGVSIVTHSDSGNRPLKVRHPRQEGPVVVRRGSWLGLNVTVLFGTTIGPYAHVGACSFVKHNVPPNTFCAGIPAQVLKTYNDDCSRHTKE